MIEYGEILTLAPMLAAAGIVAGLLAGLFGIGGGAVLVPVFYQLFSMIGVDEAVRMHLSVGTSLGVIVPTSLRSFSGHLKMGTVDKAVLRSIALPVVAGVAAGSLLAAYVTGGVLKAVFCGVALFVAIRMLLGRDDWRLGDDLPDQPLIGIYGFGTGVLSTLMGIGGGIFGNTIMMLYGRPIHQAVSTSSGLGVLIAIPGVLGFMFAGWGRAGLPALSAGYVSLIGVALVIPLSIVAAPFGVRLAHWASKRRLEIAFAIFLILVSARFAYSLL